MTLPYTYMQCPCADPSTLSRTQDASTPTANGDDDERTFNPRAPRSSYSLYPLEYLLYCEDCQQIRCPRCVAEEIVTFYCPNCLFEVPSSNIKSEGNRCTRNCFQCPVCIGPLYVSSLETPQRDPALLSAESASAPTGGPYILTCSYCRWTSTEIGVKFERSNAIVSQLARIRNGGRPRQTVKERRDRRKESAATITSSTATGSALATVTSVTSPTSPLSPVNAPLPLSNNNNNPPDIDIETHFTNLRFFYHGQLAETGGGVAGMSALSDLGFSSPGSLSRIMSLYTSGSLYDKSKGRASMMREAADPEEGLRLADLDESRAINQLFHDFDTAWDDTASHDQRDAQPPLMVEPELHGRARFASELRPIPYLLRTKRSKRCPVCRHIISKPEQKVGSNRFRIRLIAGSYIPTISIKPLPIAPPVTPFSSSSRPVSTAIGVALTTLGSTTAFSPVLDDPPPPLRPAPPPLPPSLGTSTSTPNPLAPTGPLPLLTPHQPVQFLLTFGNPIFERVKVSLATPATTPGRFASKVTLLCPQFEMDPNSDVWDEAMKDGGGAGAGTGGGSNTGGGRVLNSVRRMGGMEDDGVGVAEAGKIWDRGRNWVTVVVEVVPASLRTADEADGDVASVVKEDEDILEIPMYVRLEWEVEGGQDDVGTIPGKEKEGKERRELAYWCVLGLGRISPA